MLEELTEGKVFIFGKDKKGKFLFCNENHAKIAGLDSPAQIIGKTDYDLFWKQNADYCRYSDSLSMQGHLWENAVENLTRYDGTFDICISKYQMLDENNNCIGVVGSYYDISNKGSFSIKKKEKYTNNKKIYLGNAFPGEYLTACEYGVFKCLILSMTSKRIAIALGISIKTVEFHISNIKRKLQCNYKKDLIITAVQYGLVNL